MNAPENQDGSPVRELAKIAASAGLSFVLGVMMLILFGFFSGGIGWLIAGAHELGWLAFVLPVAAGLLLCVPFGTKRALTRAALQSLEQYQLASRLTGQVKSVVQRKIAEKPEGKTATANRLAHKVPLDKAEQLLLRGTESVLGSAGESEGKISRKVRKLVLEKIELVTLREFRKQEDPSQIDLERSFQAASDTVDSFARDAIAGPAATTTFLFLGGITLLGIGLGAILRFLG